MFCYQAGRHHIKFWPSFLVQQSNKHIEDVAVVKAVCFFLKSPFCTYPLSSLHLDCHLFMRSGVYGEYVNSF